MLKSLEKSAEKGAVDSEYSDALASQVLVLFNIRVEISGSC